MNQTREQARIPLNSPALGVYCYSYVLNEKNITFSTPDKGKFIYTEGGTIYVFTEEKTWYLLARHYIWIPKGVSFRIQADNSNIILRTICFESLANDAAFYNQIGVYPMNDLLLEMIEFIKNWEGPILPENECRYTFLMAIKAILPELSKHKLPIQLPAPKDERLKKIADYLRHNLASPLHLTDIAQHFGMSERSLARLFQNDLKMSYIKYLRALRVIYALELLTTTKLSINEIAFKVGYDSFPTFSNMFQQMVGVRPKTYLQQKL